jgi:acyl dehydratase
MAIATHAVLRAVCGYDSARIKAVECRFTSPTFPGDKIVTEIWQDGKNVSFRSKVPARNVTTVDHGLVELT